MGLLLTVVADNQALAQAVPPDASEVLLELAGLLDPSAAGTPEMPGAMLRVEAPASGLVWTAAVGTSDLSTGEALRPEHGFRIASQTKTFVAAAILRLHEAGRLDLDAPVAGLLLPETVAALAGDGYAPAAITPRMLLQHTSGLFDFASTDAFMARAMAEPRHRWTRAEQLALAMAAGEPLAAPGAAFHYSDTGYILLGEILETVTDKPMAQAVRDLLDFEGLGLADTWFESLEPPPPGAPPRAHQYMGPLDAYDTDPSVDLFGGGGLVSSLPDLARFYRALLRGVVLAEPASLAAMIEPTAQSRAAMTGGYGMGIVVEEIAGLDCYGHGGFWGSLAWHCPAIDLTVVGAVNGTAGKERIDSAVRSAIGIVAATGH